MKIALLADTHFGARGDSLMFNEYFMRFYDNVFFPELKKRNITQIFHFGDFTDRRKYINFNILSKVRSGFIKRVHDEGLKMDGIVGNHDTPFKNTNIPNSMDELFHDNPDVTVYSEPTEILIGETKVLLLPWINTENYDKSMRMILETDATVCFGHLEVQGFLMYRGAKNEHGLDRSVFDKFTQVFSGHFHHKSDDGIIFYLGAPYEMTFSDMNDPRGFHIWDSETGDLEFIQNPYRMFHKIYYDDREKTLEQLLRKDFDKYASTFVKVVVTNKTNPYFFDQWIDKLYASNPADIKIEEEVKLDSDGDALSIDMAEDTLTILGNYVDLSEIDADKEKVKELIRTLYIEASNLERE